MTGLNAPCQACEILAGRGAAPGGVLLRAQGFALYAPPMPVPVRGWLVLVPERHVRQTADLLPEDAARLGALAQRVMAAQRQALGAELVYAVALGEALHHAHLHLVPRYADTPAHLRGARIFLAGPEEGLPEADVLAAARAVARRLAPAG